MVCVNDSRLYRGKLHGQLGWFGLKVGSRLENQMNPVNSIDNFVMMTAP